MYSQESSHICSLFRILGWRPQESMHSHVSSTVVEPSSTKVGCWFWIRKAHIEGCPCPISSAPQPSGRHSRMATSLEGAGEVGWVFILGISCHLTANCRMDAPTTTSPVFGKWAMTQGVPVYLESVALA